jgi:hypothetical protein
MASISFITSFEDDDDVMMSSNFQLLSVNDQIEQMASDAIIVTSDRIIEFLYENAVTEIEYYEFLQQQQEEQGRLLAEINQFNQTNDEIDGDLIAQNDDNESNDDHISKKSQLPHEKVLYYYKKGQDVNSGLLVANTARRVSVMQMILINDEQKLMEHALIIVFVTGD